jgi:hypothetical protein
MPAVITLDFYENEARRVGAEVAHELALRATLGTAVAATQGVPVETGELRFSQRHRIRRVGLSSHGSVWYTADHAAAVHEGARPHIIRPRRRGGVLVFDVGGRTVFTKMVRHPGYKGNPWLYRAMVGATRPLGFRTNRARGR